MKAAQTVAVVGESGSGKTTLGRLALQPDLQYVHNPGASRELENAWILGLRLELAFAAE